MNENHTIGQLAKTAGVNVETIRYYERRGLIRQPPKPATQTQPWLGFYSSNAPRNWVLRWRRSTTCCHWASRIARKSRSWPKQSWPACVKKLTIYTAWNRCWKSSSQSVGPILIMRLVLLLNPSNLILVNKRHWA